MVDGIFGVIVLGCGVYCLYGYYMLKFKREINRTILLPKDIDIRKCKDYEGYCREMELPLLLLGLIVTVYGAVDLYNTYVGGIQALFMIIMMVIVVVALALFALKTRKCVGRYF